MTNPIESEKYINLDEEIKELKKLFPNIKKPEEKQTLIKEINDKTRQKTELVKNSIKDPKSVFEASIIFFTLLFSDIENEDIENINENYQYIERKIITNINKVNKILPYMNPKSPEEVKSYQAKLNSMISDLYMEKPLSKETLSKLNLKDSKYLAAIFNPDMDFVENFSKFLKVLEENKNKATIKMFNDLEQNRNTKRLFQKYNLDYDKWISVSPNTQVTVKIKTNAEKTKQNVLKNIEADFNDEAMKKIPDKERKSLFNALKKAGFDIIEKEVANYDDEGIMDSTTIITMIYKNGKPLVFEDTHKLISAIRNEMNRNEFWNYEDNIDDIDNAKFTLRNHLLKLRYNEIKKAEAKNTEDEKTIVIQKADMNDISHALFLGNDAGCCTAIGTGCNMWSAPNYIMNKFVSCIEVKQGNKYVGNTMIYPAIIDKKPALLLDNIELKPDYQYNEQIRKGFFECAQNIAQETGMPDMPIYAGPNRHKVNMDGLEIIKNKDFKILGSSGNDKVYFDFMTGSTRVEPDKTYHCYDLFKIR